MHESYLCWKETLDVISFLEAQYQDLLHLVVMLELAFETLSAALGQGCCLNHYVGACFVKNVLVIFSKKVRRVWPHSVCFIPCKL